MILVDTSVWVDFLRVGNDKLADLLNANQVLTHPFIIGELACGNLRNRAEILSLLAALPRTAAATDSEVLFLIERRRLMGRGIGYIDAHLLASAALSSAAEIWTRDKRLAALAADLGVAHRQ